LPSSFPKSRKSWCWEAIAQGRANGHAASNKNILLVAVRDQPLAVERRYEEHVETAQVPWHRQHVVYMGGDVINSITVDPVTKLVLTTWQAAPTGHNAFLTKMEGEGLFAPGVHSIHI
jgi:hypothetical protein